ncbi:MAG TPA: YlcI/YnfO family protein [Candidatus Limnocylindrales bacterium]
MVKFALRIPDEVHRMAKQAADRDESSLNEWIVQAIDREVTRRALLAHNEYVKNNPSYSVDRWKARQAEIEAAIRAARE